MLNLRSLGAVLEWDEQPLLHLHDRHIPAFCFRGLWQRVVLPFESPLDLLPARTLLVLHGDLANCRRRLRDLILPLLGCRLSRVAHREEDRPSHRAGAWRDLG